MTKKPIQIRARARTVRQIADLRRWWPDATIADVVSEAVSRAWHVEAARRNGYNGAPWTVEPGPRHFQNEACAIAWLRAQGAERLGPDSWVTYDDDGCPTVWEAEPLRFER